MQRVNEVQTSVVKETALVGFRSVVPVSVGKCATSTNATSKGAWT